MIWISQGTYVGQPRQQDILRLMADGLVKKEIADALDISVNTVSTHMQRVYEKPHVTSNTGAVAKALREKLIRGPLGDSVWYDRVTYTFGKN